MTKENQRKHSGSQFGEQQSNIVGGAAVGASGSQAHKFLSQEEREMKDGVDSLPSLSLNPT